MPLPRTIAVDGPAGSGKSSVMFIIAQELGYTLVDTGAFYRMVTLAVLEAKQLNAVDTAIVEVARRCQMAIRSGDVSDGRQYTALLDGRDVTWAIRGADVEANVSRISAIPAVREVVTAQQRAIAASGQVIMVGRDIGTVVLPNADLKLFLDASSEARAQRRYQQSVSDGKAANLDAIRENIQARDTLDSTRQTAPLTQAPDAVYIDTDHLSIEQVVTRIKQIIQDWKAQSPTG